MQLDHLLSKHRVLHVQVWLFAISDEELRSIGVGTIVGHGNHPTDTVLNKGENLSMNTHL